jgi:phage tail sheath protein FI
VQALKGRGDRPPGADTDPMFGFGALYHPWLYCADPNRPTTFRRTPPDGAAAGVVAARTVGRGAWVSPANQPLQDVLALDAPVPPDDYQALADAQVNFVRDDPGGFLWLAADTLTDDPQVRPIGVRRLLALLRRTAERYGDERVFEPNDEVARRALRRTFETLLSSMYSAGAFAGATASEAYAVTTPVTAADLDAGRLIVELLVAPSQPLAFLTVRLVQSGTGTLQVTTR